MMHSCLPTCVLQLNGQVNILQLYKNEAGHTNLAPFLTIEENLNRDKHTIKSIAALSDMATLAMHKL